MIYVDKDHCTGCGLCVETCPTGAIRLVDGVAQVEQSLCRECEVCLSACPNGAILAMREPSGSRTAMRARVPAPTPTQHSGMRRWLGSALAFVEEEVVPRATARWGNRERPGAVSYHPTGMSSRRSYGGRGRGRRARRRRGRW